MIGKVIVTVLQNLVIWTAEEVQIDMLVGHYPIVEHIRQTHVEIYVIDNQKQKQSKGVLDC